MKKERNKSCNRGVDKNVCIYAGEVHENKEKIKYYAMEFPQRWFEKAREFFVFKDDEDTEKVSIPYGSLTQSINALNIGIIKVNELYEKKLKTWIMATSEIPCQLIFDIVRAWFSVEYNDVSRSEVEQEMLRAFIQDMDVTELHQQICEIDISKFDVEDNGTAKLQGDAYDVLPNYVAQILVENNKTISLGELSLNFIRCKNELISYPPQECISGKKKYYYSYYIRLDLKTIPNNPYPILLINSGIKRYANGVLCDKIGCSEDTTVYIKYNDGAFLEPKMTLGIDKVRGKIVKDKNGVQQYYLEYKDNVQKILKIAMGSYLPTFNNIQTDSESYIKENYDLTLLYEYNNQNLWSHHIKKGISMAEQNELCQHIINQFDFLKNLNEEYPTIKIAKRCKKSDLEMNKIELLDFIREESKRTNKVNIELVYQTTMLLRLVIKCLLQEAAVVNHNIADATPNENEKLQQEYVDKLERNKEVEIKFNFSNSEILINISAHLAGNIISKIENRKYQQREQQVRNFMKINFGKERTNAFTIVEINSKQSYKLAEDPKQVIRTALYKENRLNQFITTDSINVAEQVKVAETIKKKQKEPKNNLEESKDTEQQAKNQETIMTSPEFTVRSAILEYFRQRGTMLGTISTQGMKGVPESMNIVGFNLLSTNSNAYKDILNYPVATLVETGNKDIYIWTPDTEGWCKYSDAILKLGAMNIRTKKYTNDQVAKFFRSVLSECKDDDTLVIVDASNRITWSLTNFQNSKLKLNQDYDDLKKVRIFRVKNNNEIPRVTRLNNHGIPFFVQGLYRIRDNVYYSNEGKNSTATNIYDSSYKHQRVGMEFKASHAMEIVPISVAEQDDIDSFAYLINKLRYYNVTYINLTVVPMVNHIAKSIQEVIIGKEIESEKEK